MSQPFGFSCRGGLNTNLNEFDILEQPGYAKELLNFEVDPDGGYRRVNGYIPYGTTRPEGSNKILGIIPYALGIVVCVDTSIYYTEDGITWTQINKDTGHSGALQADLAGLSELDRPNQGQAQFAIMESPSGHLNSLYGSLSIATGPNKVAHFHIDGTGPTRLFIYEELNTPSAGKYIEIHDKHLCVVDTENAPSTLYISSVLDDRAFTGVGAYQLQITDNITGIKSFRDSLYIFCQNSIHRLDNINDSGTIAIIQVTNNVGCLSGYSIQEIGGDLLFLAPDGIRQVSATARINDVELSSTSRAIQSIVASLTKNIDDFIISSVVLRNKSQYRLYYAEESSGINTARGIIGTFTPRGFEWSETKGIQVTAISSNFKSTSQVDEAFHGDYLGYIYQHDIGNYFYSNGTPQTINASYKTPFLDFGDVGTLKTLKYAKVSFTPEGSAVYPTLRVRYDYDDPAIAKPPDYSLGPILGASLFGSAIFGTSFFGGASTPMKRISIQGSGHSCNFQIFSNDNYPAYAVNGIYFNYTPAGRR